MKCGPVIPSIAFGIAVGFLLPVGSGDHSASHGIDKRSDEIRSEQSRRKHRDELRDILLDDGERQNLAVRKAANLSELLAALRESGSSSPDDASRVVDMDPLAALNQLLPDPSARADLCEMIATEWARRDPDRAIAHLRNQTSYRADDCLCQAMIAAYTSRPNLVAEVLRSKSRRWQEIHLKDFFDRSYEVRKPGVAQPLPNDDPFADDPNLEAFPITSLLDSLADDDMRATARKISDRKDSPSTPFVSPQEKGPETLDPEHFDSADFIQRERLHEQLANQREQTIALLAEKGSYQARAAAIGILTADFPYDPKSWPQALSQLEDWIAQLDAIPTYPPSHFEMGPFLKGTEAAEWILRQPLALQRAWAPTFTETWAESDPEPALDWAKQLPEAAKRDETFQTGMIVWAHREPLKAAAYAGSLPPGDLRENAISNTAAAWACTDRTGAKAWLDSLPDSPGKTRGIERIK